MRVHPCCGLWPGRLSPRLKFRMLRVFSGRTGQASGAFTMVSTEKHTAQAGDPTRQWYAEACRSQARSSSSRSSRVWSSEASGWSCWIIMKMSRENRQVSARESSSSADRRDNSTGATMAWPNSSSASLLDPCRLDEVALTSKDLKRCVVLRKRLLNCLGSLSSLICGKPHLRTFWWFFRRRTGQGRKDLASLPSIHFWP